MIRSLLGKIIDKATGKTGGKRARLGKRVEIGEAEHGIAPTLLDDDAVSVVRTLREAGYDAYIVGGAVRDLLLGLQPKDFDVATSATPEEVKKLFRRAYIVGRRFRIVHVVFGRWRAKARAVVEVSTFRAWLNNEEAERIAGDERSARQQLAGLKHAVDASGRVLRDNVWGSQIEDAARRDFSVNAMYYEPDSRILVDYHGGMADARARRIRMIGEPAARYREDPVRILRAVRFAAKLSPLGFVLDAATARPLKKSLPLLADVPPSRMFDEMLKLLQTGHAEASVQTLRDLGLERGVYPLLDLIVQRADEPLVRAALHDSDRRIAAGRPVTASFLLACVLWQDVRAAWQQRLEQGEHATPALHAAIDEVFGAHVGEVSGRGRLGAEMRDIWLMQPRFEKRTGASAHSLAAQQRFRAALDMLRLRAESGEADEELCDWWQLFERSDEGDRESLVQRQRAARSSARKKTAPKKAPDGEAAEDTAEAPAPKKRRRRRRPRKKTEGGEGSAGENDA